MKHIDAIVVFFRMQNDLSDLDLNLILKRCSNAVSRAKQSRIRIIELFECNPREMY